MLTVQEAMAMAAAGSHPNIVRYYSSWTEQQGEGQMLYILMELCNMSLATQQSLGDHSFKEAELVEILRQVCHLLCPLRLLICKANGKALARCSPGKSSFEECCSSNAVADCGMQLITFPLMGKHADHSYLSLQILCQSGT